MSKSVLTKARCREMFSHVYALQDIAALTYFTLEYGVWIAEKGYYDDYRPFELSEEEMFEFYYFIVNGNL